MISILTPLVFAMRAIAANELQFNLGETGATVYAVVFNDSGLAWNGSAFVTYTTTRGTFDVPMTEVGVTGLYRVTFPASAGARHWEYFLQAGGSPSHTADISIGVGSGYWTGSAFGTAGTTATAVVDNTQVDDAFVVDLSKRNDGTTRATKTIYLNVGEKQAVWINTKPVTGGKWLADVTDADTDTPDELAVSSFGVNRELAVVQLDATDAVVDSTYTLTVNITPNGSHVLVAKVSVVIVGD